MLIGASSEQAASPHVVILGGGFGGLQAARALAGRPVRVTFVDRENHHLFQPLLYQVATAALSPGDIAKPLRSILRGQGNLRVMLGEATAIDVTNRTVSLADGHLTYDYLIVATGARHSYFDHPEWESVAPGLKALDDAIEIRHRVLCAFEAAEWAPTSAAQRELLTFVVIGGGPTGVEMAGAIAELARSFVSSRVSSHRPDEGQGDPARRRPTHPADLSSRTLSQRGACPAAAGRGSTGWALVTAITPEAVHIGDEIISSRTIVSAAGNSASPLGRMLAVPLDRNGRVLVQSDLTVPGHPEVYVIGDLAAFVDQNGTTLPGLAPVAIQQGRAAAENVWRTIRGRERRRFSYRDRGNLATVGRAAGLADLGPLQLSGVVAWIAWLGVHLFWLIGFDNRLLVLFKWAWSYLTHERGARLIIREWRRSAPSRHLDGRPVLHPVCRGAQVGRRHGRDGRMRPQESQPSDAALGVGNSSPVPAFATAWTLSGAGRSAVDGVRSADGVRQPPRAAPEDRPPTCFHDGRVSERGFADRDRLEQRRPPRPLRRGWRGLPPRRVSKMKAVLVPLDGSELAERAVPFAATIATKSGWSLLLLRAVNTLVPRPMQRGGVETGCPGSARRRGDIARGGRREGCHPRRRWASGDADPRGHRR